MSATDWLLTAALVTFGSFMLTETVRTPSSAPATVSADSGRFDYVYIVSPVYLYQGNQGVLLLDKRDGNLWFFAKGNEMKMSFHDPVLVSRLPLEKLDQSPR